MVVNALLLGQLSPCNVISLIPKLNMQLEHLHYSILETSDCFECRCIFGLWDIGEVHDKPEEKKVHIHMGGA